MPRTVPALTARLLASPEYLRQRYVADGLTIAQLAAELDCSVPTVHRALVAHDIPRRRRGPHDMLRLAGTSPEGQLDARPGS